MNSNSWLPLAKITIHHQQSLSPPFIFTKRPPGLQPAAIGQHAKWPGGLHCPRSKGPLSATWQSWLMAIMMVMMGDALQTPIMELVLTTYDDDDDDDDAFLSQLS